MHPYQQQFIELALRHNVLRFGHFTLKSGRTSPYFFNLGQIASGASLAQLGQAYAARLMDSQLDADMLFGPAYKGIPLATTTATALALTHERDMPIAYNRKEPKDHGEGGLLVGAPLQGRVLIIDDVITAGTAIRQSIELIRAHGAVPAGVLIALDRQERGARTLSATQELTEEFGLPVFAIVTLDDIMQFMQRSDTLQDDYRKMQVYRQSYGVS